MQRLRDQLLSSGSTSLLPLPLLPLPLQNRSVRNLLLSITLGLLSASGAWAQEEEFPGEKIVHLFDEPRHRPVRQEGDLYLLDVRIKPGDVSFPHVHDQAILLTYISLARGPQNGRVGVNTDYASEPFTHKVSNDGPGLFHIIALVHDGSGRPASSNDQPSGMGVAPEIENDWFRSWRYELQPGESTAMQSHSNPTFIVMGGEGIAHVSREDGITRELAHPGDWAWREAGSSYRLTNVGGSPVTVIVNEGRLQD